MHILEIVLTVFLVVISVILILLILIQSNRNAGMGLFGGGASQTAFGSSSADVLTKMTAILAGFFMLITLGLAFIKSSTTDKDEISRRLKAKKAAESSALKENTQNTTDGKDKADAKTGEKTGTATTPDKSKTGGK